MNTATLTCPKCGTKEKIEMPDDRCLQFHRCFGCNSLITVPKGGCCIICSYTDKKCPLPHR